MMTDHAAGLVQPCPGISTPSRAICSHAQADTRRLQDGSVEAYVAQLPPLYCAHGTRVAYLTALREVAVADVTDARYRCSFDADGEPSLLALCETGLAMAWASKVRLCAARHRQWSLMYTGMPAGAWPCERGRHVSCTWHHCALLQHGSAWCTARLRCVRLASPWHGPAR